MDVVDIRHLDGILNNFGVSDNDCFIGTAERDRNQIVSSSSSAIVEILFHLRL